MSATSYEEMFEEAWRAGKVAAVRHILVHGSENATPPWFAMRLTFQNRSAPFPRWLVSTGRAKNSLFHTLLLRCPYRSAQAAAAHQAAMVAVLQRYGIAVKE